MDQHKPIISIDHIKCAPCSGLVCIGVCPQGILEAGTDNKPQVIDVSSCTRCGVCVNLCPSRAITLESQKTSKE